VERVTHISRQPVTHQWTDLLRYPTLVEKAFSFTRELSFFFLSFLQRVRNVRNAERSNSYKDSVCPSVRLSRSGTVARRMKIRCAVFSIW